MMKTNGSLSKKNEPSPLTAHFGLEARKLAKLLAVTQADPSPKHVHDLRICVRRLRTMLWLLAEEKNEGARDRDKLARRLRKLGHRLGALRDLDVTWQTVGGPRDRSLRKLRQRKKKEVAARLHRPYRERLARLTRDVAEDLRRSHRASSPDPLLRLRRHLDEWAAIPPRSPSGYHRLRITVKKIRYTLETAGRPVSQIKKFQDALGRVHDVETLRHLPRPLATRSQQETAVRAAKRMLGPALRDSRRELAKLEI